MKTAALYFGIVIAQALLSLAAQAAPPQDAALLAKGRAAFANNCVICHGEHGTGDGMAAAGLNPKPRDFTKGEFKQGAASEQIFKTITTGLAGSPMPAFQQLSEEERWGLVYFVKSLKKTL